MRLSYITEREKRGEKHIFEKCKKIIIIIKKKRESKEEDEVKKKKKKSWKRKTGKGLATVGTF